MKHKRITFRDTKITERIEDIKTMVKNFLENEVIINGYSFSHFSGDLYIGTKVVDDVVYELTL